MSDTLFLAPNTWDLCADLSGNIAVASPPYSTAQDIASACRLFLGELWYNTTAGIPYFGEILGQQPSLSYVQAQLQAAALTVPNVVTATVVLTGVVNRGLTGQVQFTTSNGEAGVAGF
jgi:hypothetical protein